MFGLEFIRQCDSLNDKKHRRFEHCNSVIELDASTYSESIYSTLSIMTSSSMSSYKKRMQTFHCYYMRDKTVVHKWKHYSRM